MGKLHTKNMRVLSQKIRKLLAFKVLKKGYMYIVAYRGAVRSGVKGLIGLLRKINVLSQEILKL